MIKGAPTVSTSRNKNLQPQIFFEDQHLIVLSKPAGLLSQGAEAGEENLVDWLRVYLGRPYVGLVHRLDRNTSGIMIVAKRTKSANRLTEALQEGKIIRTYRAWVEGHLPRTVKWTHSLSKNPNNNVVTVVRTGGKKSSLTATPLETGKWNQLTLTLVEFLLETGRSHQIRVQSAFEGFPLLGDRKYGSPEGGRFERVALHSYFLKFPHPMSGEWMEFTDPLPADLAALENPTL